VFHDITAREVAAEAQIHVEHGKPLIFGASGDKGLRLKPGALQLEVVRLGDNGVGAGDLLVHDETNRMLATALGAMQPPDFPTALGVIFCDPATSFGDAVQAQAAEAKERRPKADLNALMRRGHTWRVE
jgi:2-oxoglutarate ferredoxin oxidoreductase subunit beta